MRRFEVTITSKSEPFRKEQIEARNMDSAVNKAFKLCKKGEVAFVTKEINLL